VDRLQTLRLLLEAGASPSHANGVGNTPFHLVRSTPVLRLLTQAQEIAGGEASVHGAMRRRNAAGARLLDYAVLPPRILGPSMGLGQPGPAGSGAAPSFIDAHGAAVIAALNETPTEGWSQPPCSLGYADIGTARDDAGLGDGGLGRACLHPLRWRDRPPERSRDVWSEQATFLLYRVCAACE
jgi:hypothetical protein